MEGGGGVVESHVMWCALPWSGEGQGRAGQGKVGHGRAGQEKRAAKMSVEERPLGGEECLFRSNGEW